MEIAVTYILSEEQKARKREYNKKRRRNLTPEQKEAQRIQQKIYKQNLSSEQKAKINARAREYQRRPEIKARLAAYKLKYYGRKPSPTPDRYRSGSKYPGKYCKKRAADMTDEERKQHHIYVDAKNKWVREHETDTQKSTYQKKSAAYRRLVCKELGDGYIRECLVRMLKCKSADVPDDLIEVKRQQLKLRRIVNDKEI